MTAKQALDQGHAIPFETINVGTVDQGMCHADPFFAWPDYKIFVK